MKPKFFFFFLLIIGPACICIAQAQVVLNGGLEKIDPVSKLPVAWQNFMGDKDNYDFKTDSGIVQQGKYSMSISSKNNDGNFGAVSCVIPYTFKGRQVQLKGFLKTENVTGYAGFWVRIDGTAAFDNMQKQNIHGTNDWQEYTITLPYDNKNAININAGALLSGKGKIWFDNIRLFIDGKSIEKASLSTSELFNAQKDTAFSKASGIGSIAGTEQELKNLTLLGQVWGFVKYHLPAVAKGDINMDAELFRVMPAVIKAQNYAEACAAIEQWVDKLGVPADCSDFHTFKDRDIAQKPDYGEIFDRSIVSASLADKLAAILKNRDFGKNYYVAMTGVGNPDFTHELPYKNMDYPDNGFRLLCLFRYWNMIQYFYPYKHLIGQDWDKTLPDFIPRFIEAKDAEAYDLAAMALISSIHDTHANIWSNLKGLSDYRGKYAPPFQAKFIENKLVITAYYNDTLGVKDKIKTGDIITAINGVGVEELIKKYLPITAASNYETQLRDMPRNYLLRSNNPDFTFELLRGGNIITVNQGGIAYTKLNYLSVYNPNPNDPGYRLIDKQIGYLYPGKYFNKDLPAIKELFKNTKGIVIDMRCYPSEFMPFTFVPYIKTGDAKFVKFTFGSVFYPGLFQSAKSPLGIKAANEYKGKVVVIVNEESQSQAEYTTMAFQSSPNVIVIGSTTAGADGNVSTIILPGGITTLISGIGILYPDGTETQRKGVKIDEVVKPTIAGIKAGLDEPLERAKTIIGE